MQIIIVIPARYQSSRFPGKPLADILGKPMIQHVYERACLATCTDRVIVATDDQRIADAVKGFGGEVMMTSPHHPSGTDRVVEVAQRVAADIYINVQGDEPLIRPADIDFLAEDLVKDPSCDVTTLCHPISIKEALDPNTVKLIRSHRGNALYFSRNPIPYISEHAGLSNVYFKHVGVYAYRAAVLARYQQLPDSDLEKWERLEQLRLLQADFTIKTVQTYATGPGVDTPNCLKRVIEIMAREQTYGAALAN
jgi:3-deoxy-D-manno-octulosonate 8-phosphate phosphatase (KDO 8-P phosphatase)